MIKGVLWFSFTSSTIWGNSLPNFSGGTVIGFYDEPAGRFTRGGVHAVIRWDNRPNAPERVRLSDIHRGGGRSAGGSPVGLLVAG